VVRNNKGNVAALIAGAIVLIGVFAIITTLTSQKRARTLASQQETATEEAARKLEELFNLPFADTNLTRGTHTEGSFSWDVVMDTPQPRLKKIIVRQALKVSGKISDETVGVVGYKYNDF